MDAITEILSSGAFTRVQADALRALLATVVGGGGVTDHGALTGLGDDDHSGVYAPASHSHGATAITEPVTALSITAGVVNIDCSLGNMFTLTLTENVTSITFSNLPAAGFGKTILVYITQGAGPYTVAFPASFDWQGGTVGVVSTANGAKDLLAITTFDQGTSWPAALGKAHA